MIGLETTSTDRGITMSLKSRVKVIQLGWEISQFALESVVLVEF